MHFSPFPESLAAYINRNFPRTHLYVAMLDIDHLRACIDDGDEKGLTQEWLHQKEQEKLQALHYEKRHFEWLGGRICAKQVSLQYLHNNPSAPATLRAPQFRIMTAASGRPFMDNNTLPEGLHIPDISISHSKRYALAVAASTPCGIDIQVTSDALGRVQDRFCSDEEERLLSRELKKIQLPDHLTLLWAAKEAIKKGAELARMPGFLDLELTHIQNIPEAGGLTNSLFTLDYQDSHKESGNPQLQFQVTVCLHQGYGIGLYVQPGRPCPETKHA